MIPYFSMLMAMTLIKVVVGHFHTADTPITIHGKTIYDIANDVRVSVCKHFAIEMFRNEVIVIIFSGGMSSKFVNDFVSNGIITPGVSRMIDDNSIRHQPHSA